MFIQNVVDKKVNKISLLYFAVHNSTNWIVITEV